jgi:nucleoside-diphosphate-sugar epimerase
MGRPELIQLGAIPARANDTPLLVGENSRLVSEVGWKQQYELEAGLLQTIDWWRAQK